MKKSAVSIVLVAGLTASPAQALDLGGLAGVILGNNATLKKGAETCPNKLTLTNRDISIMTLARSAAEQALPSNQLFGLDKKAEADASSEAKTPDYCDRTAKKKNRLLDAVKKAGKKLVTARVLGM